MFYTAVPTTPDKHLTVPSTPDVFHTAVPQTPLLPPTEQVDNAELNKREKQQRLNMIKVSLSLLKIQRDEALARNDKEAAMMAMRSLDNSNEEKWRLEKDLENCNISSESFEDQEKGDDDEDNDNNEAVPESNDTITKVQEEDNNDDDENNVCQDFACKQCGDVQVKMVKKT